jgi:4-amino-4-deoxy-L-arabinose transferase-like glycosyltransferase
MLAKVDKWLRDHKIAVITLLMALAFILRVAFILFVNQDRMVWGDELRYDKLAISIWKDGCYCNPPGRPTALIPPLYSAILALIYSFTNRSITSVLVMQALASSLSVGMVWIVAGPVTGHFWIRLLSAAIYAINPLIIYTTSVLYSESFYIFILLIAFYFLNAQLAKKGNWLLGAIIGGILLGVANLMRANMLLLPVFFFLAVWANLRNIGQALVRTLVITLAMLVVLSPWTIRNYSVTGRIVMVSTNSGLLLMQGNNDLATGTGVIQDEFDQLPNLTEVDRSAVYWNAGMTWIINHPGKFILLVPQKIYKFFSPLERTNQGTMDTKLAPFLYGAYMILYLLALAGFIRTISKWRKWLLVLSMIVYPVGLAVIFFGGTRYGLVVQPFISIYSATGLVWLISNLKKWVNKTQISSVGVN